ncbi:MAG: DUF1304 domain-containing protein [Saprospiraceae bacterium]|nr:DUF1304 domain-containing protein [Saprospiraceae bacterium]
MEAAISILTGIVVIEHLCFMYIEMFEWKRMGQMTFKSYPESFFNASKGLAANQGLYNGFLAVGLIWTFFITDVEWKQAIAVYFLSCIVLAGIYGAITISRKIFYIQGLPALVALIGWLLMN